MALEVLHNQAATHENEQFRRVVNLIDAAFEKHGYSGLLIGNPHNERFRRFRADAILIYDKGVVIIDFKDYSGQLTLPLNDDDFINQPWYAESTSDHQSVEVKGGAHFINPFRQLASYRNAFKEIIETNINLKEKINPSRVCIANIFSGPLELNTKIPGKFRYYKLIQEKEIGQFLYDLNNDNAYSKDIADVFKGLFPADKYVREYNAAASIVTKQDIIVEEDAKDAIDAFLKTSGNDILVLASMDCKERDNWARYLFSIADENGIPEVESLCHSTRIGRRLQARGIEAASIYSSIYGGSTNLETGQSPDEDSESSMQVIPIKSNIGYDEKSMILILDAHLVNRSLSQSELLRFGSGRVLEDLLLFMDPSSKRKLVFIGDPYMLTYGSSEDSAMNISTLKELCGERIIHYYSQPVFDDCSSNKHSLRCHLAKSMDNNLFNNLSYQYDGSLRDIDHDGIIRLMKDWFCTPFNDEPNCAVLFYKKTDCAKTNLWIKKSCLSNGNSLAAGDLLVANNNICIPDETGFGNPRRILNGMYFTVNAVKDSLIESISINDACNPVTLSFTQVSVKCLSLNKQDADIWILDNYLQSDDELSKEEQIAMRVFVKNRLTELKKRSPFRDSIYYTQLLNDDFYQGLLEEDKNVVDILISNRDLPKECQTKISTTKEIRGQVKKFYDRYLNSLQQELRETDSLVNALYAKYGWAITVHKGIGSAFENIILKGYRGENLGSNNDGYYRWLYSGITSCDGIFYLTQPQTINPFMKCNIHDSSNELCANSKRLLTYNQYNVDNRFKEAVSKCKPNTAAAICELTKELEKNDCLLERVDVINEYLSKAVYYLRDRANVHIVMDINNKGAKDFWAVSSIRTEPQAVIDNSILDNAIESVFCNGGNKTAELQCPSYIQEIYSAMADTLLNRGISMQKIDSKDYQDTFLLKSSNESAKVRFWYGTSTQSHNKGMINKIEFLESSGSSILNDVRTYVSELQ